MKAKMKLKSIVAVNNAYQNLLNKNNLENLKYSQDIDNRFLKLYYLKCKPKSHQSRQFTLASHYPIEQTQTSTNNCRLCKKSFDYRVDNSKLNRQDDWTIISKYDVHNICALWAPRAYQNSSGEYVGVEEEILRGTKLKCYVCKKSGATIGCNNAHCRKSFHLPCAINNKCSFDDQKFELYCEAHKPESHSNEVEQSHLSGKITNKDELILPRKNMQYEESPLSGRVKQHINPGKKAQLFSSSRDETHRFPSSITDLTHTLKRHKPESLLTSPDMTSTHKRIEPLETYSDENTSSLTSITDITSSFGKHFHASSNPAPISSRNINLPQHINDPFLNFPDQSESNQNFYFMGSDRQKIMIQPAPAYGVTL